MLFRSYFFAPMPVLHLYGHYMHYQFFYQNKIVNNKLLASKQWAYRDLKAVGRNLDLVDMDELEDDDDWS